MFDAVGRPRPGSPAACRVYKAINYRHETVEACKVVFLTHETTDAARRALDKEMRVQALLKHANVIALIAKLVIEPGADARYISGGYMLMEFARGGDLFDKIGAPLRARLWNRA